MPSYPVSRIPLFAGIAVGGCALDLWLKHTMFAWLGMPGTRPPHWIWDEHAGFQTSLNRGALFGMGQGYVSVFAGLSVAAAVAVLWWLFVQGAARHATLTVALAAITAGMLGNLYDRLGLWDPPGMPGVQVKAVRDWVLWQYDSRWVWPNFNLADSLIVVGAALLLWEAWRMELEAKRAQGQSDAAARSTPEKSRPKMADATVQRRA